MTEKITPGAVHGPGIFYVKEEAEENMMKKIFVCVSMQYDAERTVQFARACCSYVREQGMIPIASQYLYHDETRNIHQIEDLDEGHEYLVDVRICRELMMLCDEAWIFMNKDPDDLMIMVFSMADEMEMEVHIFRKDELCGRIMV